MRKRKITIIVLLFAMLVNVFIPVSTYAEQDTNQGKVMLMEKIR